MGRRESDDEDEQEHDRDPDPRWFRFLIKGLPALATVATCVEQLVVRR